MRFQPSELMKIIMPMTIAWYLARHNLPPRLKHIAISLVLIGMPVVLIAKQPDLGTSLLILAAGVFVLFVGGLRWRWMLGALAAAVPLAVALWTFYMHDYQKRRVLTFLDPENDPLGAGWNIIQLSLLLASNCTLERSIVSSLASKLAVKVMSSLVEIARISPSVRYFVPFSSVQ